MEAVKESKSPKRSRYGIKWKMYAILILFLGFSLGVIWFFQVRMMFYFYQTSKYNELEKTALVISQMLYEKDSSSSDTHDILLEHSVANAEDIWVCKVRRDGEFITESLAQATNEPVRRLIVSNFHLFYDRAVENEGKYVALTYGGHVKQDKLAIIADNRENPDDYPYKESSTERLRAIYVTVTNVDKDTYMIVQSTSLTPIQTVTHAMDNQFILIVIILSIAALIVATIMTKLITKPIEKINTAAKRLAKGEYDADFSVSGYREIDELADTLTYASEELAKSDHLQKELISNVSHDLRTPLTMIKGYGEVMRDIPGENTSENIQIIIDETTRLSELVNDMLDLSKLQAGARKLEKQRFCLTATVRETLQRYERLVKQDGYVIRFEADGDANVVADRGMILQVLYNLINNAINYTGDDKCVTVYQRIIDNKIRISVTDTGDGIAPEEINAIWDRYYKVDKVHKRAAVGMGLGLSIVKEVLELHGASYGVDSEVGKGTTFWFELNAYDDSAPNALNGGYIEAEYEIQDKD